MNVMIDDEFIEGYRDGRTPSTPRPSGNRSDAYCHSWEVGRAEICGRPIPAYISRLRAEAIVAPQEQTR